MAFIRLPLGIRVSMEFDWNGKVVVNVYHIITATPITTITLTVASQIFEDWFQATLGSNISSAVTLTQVSAISLDVPNGPKVDNPVIPALPGGQPADSTPNNVALIK